MEDGIMNRHEEDNEQSALFKWVAASRNNYLLPDGGSILDLLFSIPNGAHLAGSGTQRKIKGARLKAQGLRPGVPDIFLAYPVGDCHGLFIEMKKAKGGSTSPEQKEWLARLNKAGYMAVVCNGWREAATVITEYLRGVIEQ